MINANDINIFSTHQKFLQLLDEYHLNSDNDEIITFIVEQLYKQAEQGIGYMEFILNNETLNVYKNTINKISNMFIKCGYIITTNEQNNTIVFDFSNPIHYKKSVKKHNSIPLSKTLLRTLKKHPISQKDIILYRIRNGILTNARKGCYQYKTYNFGFHEPLDDTTVVQNEVIQTLLNHGYQVEHQQEQTDSIYTLIVTW